LHTVTFVYEDTTKSTQTIRNGNYATAVTVDNTTYKVFNGWKVNGAIVDIATYKITADTQFVADITYKYDVKFMVDNAVYNSQIVTKNNYPTLPTNPTKAGYQFDGWSINGTDIVNTTTLLITSNTTYKAVFTKLYTVTFVYENETISTQTIRANSVATAVSVDNTTYKVFNGWKVNNEIVNITTYKINADTQFIADITYKYDVKFMNGDIAVSTQIITKDSYATVPNNPVKSGYEFDGWSLNGTDIVSNIATTKVTQNTTYTAVFTKLYTVKFVYEDETKSTQTIRNGNYATAVTVDNTTYKVFNGWKVNNSFVTVASYKIIQDTTFVADITYRYDVKFMDDETILDTQIIENGKVATTPTISTKHNYKFMGWKVDDSFVDPNTYLITNDVRFNAIYNELVWKETNSSIYTPGNVVTCGLKQYSLIDDNVHVFNKNTKQWDLVATTPDTSLVTRMLWTDNIHIFFSYQVSFNYYNYLVDTENNQLVETSFFSKSVSSLGYKVINFNGNTYLYGNSFELFNSETMQFETSEIKLPNGDYFTFKGVTYVVSNSTLYKYNENTNALEETGFANQPNAVFAAYWTDGYTLYINYSGWKSNQNFYLDEITNTWVEKTWDTAYQMTGMYVWSDGVNIYLSCKNSYFPDQSLAYVLTVKN